MKRTIIAEVKAKENEPLDRLIRRFVKKVKKGKVLEKSLKNAIMKSHPINEGKRQKGEKESWIS